MEKLWRAAPAEPLAEHFGRGTFWSEKEWYAKQYLTYNSFGDLSGGLRALYVVNIEPRNNLVLDLTGMSDARSLNKLTKITGINDLDYEFVYEALEREDVLDSLGYRYEWVRFDEPEAPPSWLRVTESTPIVVERVELP